MKPNNINETVDKKIETVIQKNQRNKKTKRIQHRICSDEVRY